MKSKLTCGDWYKIQICVSNSIRKIVNVTEVGKLVGIFTTTDGRELFMIQCEKWLLHMEKRDCTKMSKNEFVLWKLEN